MPNTKATGVAYSDPAFDSVNAGNVDTVGLVNIGAGTTSKPPLYLKSGELLTTPINGAMEFDGSDLYFTIAGQRTNLQGFIVDGTPTDGQVVTWSNLDNAAAWQDVPAPAFDPIISTPQDNDILVYSGSDWYNQPLYTKTAASITASGGTFVQPIVQIAQPRQMSFNGQVYNYYGNWLASINYAPVGITATTLNFLNIEGIVSGGSGASALNFPSGLGTVNMTALKVLDVIPTSLVSGITTFNLSALQFLLSSLSFSGWNALTTVDLSNIVCLAAGANITSSTTGLTTLTIGTTLKACFGHFICSTCALNQASVDNILIALAALNGTNGTITYSNRIVTITGTSSPPSAAGNTAKTTLAGRGCSVTTN